MFLLISCLFSLAFLVWSIRVKVSANTLSSLQPWSYRDRLLWVPSWVSSTENWDVQSLSFPSLYVSSLYTKKVFLPCLHCVVVLPFSCLSETVYVLPITAWLEKFKVGNSSAHSWNLMKTGMQNFCHQWKIFRLKLKFKKKTTVDYFKNKQYVGFL